MKKRIHEHNWCLSNIYIYIHTYKKMNSAHSQIKYGQTNIYLYLYILLIKYGQTRLNE
jgi:hypothetical protein